MRDDKSFIPKIFPLKFHFLSSLIIITLIWLPLNLAQANIIFEAYYKILSGSSHVGFVIQRYEYFPKVKEFGSTYFIQTGPLGRNIIESLQARADQNLKPISYGYTSLVGGKFKFIDAKFTKSVMMAVVSDGKNKQTIKKKLKPNTFLSTFLGYAMLNQGFSIGKKFTYKAVAEENASVKSGSAFIEKMAVQSGISGYRILNKFAAANFLNFVSLKGDTLSTEVPASRISTVLVKEPKQATRNMPVSKKNIITLFGNYPKGRINALYQAHTKNIKPAKTPKSPTPLTGPKSKFASPMSDTNKKINKTPKAQGAAKNP